MYIMCAWVCNYMYTCACIYFVTLVMKLHQGFRTSVLFIFAVCYFCMQAIYKVRTGIYKEASCNKREILFMETPCNNYYCFERCNIDAEYCMCGVCLDEAGKQD